MGQQVTRVHTHTHTHTHTVIAQKGGGTLSAFLLAAAAHAHARYGTHCCICKCGHGSFEYAQVTLKMAATPYMGILHGVPQRHIGRIYPPIRARFAALKRALNIAKSVPLLFRFVRHFTLIGLVASRARVQ